MLLWPFSEHFRQFLLDFPMNFTEQTRDVVLRASRRTNFITRAFQVTEVDVYLRLFRTYILPIITYASPVWLPKNKGDKEPLQSVYRRFRRKIAFKCNVNKDSIGNLDIRDTLCDIDRKTFEDLKKLPELYDEMFDFIETKTRSHGLHRPKFLAKMEKLRGLFPWRVTALNNKPLC